MVTIHTEHTVRIYGIGELFHGEVISTEIISEQGVAKGSIALQLHIDNDGLVDSSKFALAIEEVDDLRDILTAMSDEYERLVAVK